MGVKRVVRSTRKRASGVKFKWNTADFGKASEEAQPVLPRVPVSRNTPCPCGSGKKYKKCCLNILGH